MERLHHRRTLKDEASLAVDVPLSPALARYGETSYVLVRNPNDSKRTVTSGMFVVRPAFDAWSGGTQKKDFSHIADWTFAVKGITGSSVIAGGSPLDVYMLVRAHALCDAVFVGSSTVLAEGLAHEGSLGLVWQPYSFHQWAGLDRLAPHLLTELADFRKQLVAKEILSAQREYPAQIIVTQSGEARSGEHDLFDASVFYASLPNGRPVETYILTSVHGAEKLCARADKYGLERRMKDMLIVSSPDGKPGDLDLSDLPGRLFRDHDIRVATHDGGPTVMSAFAAAGVLDQLQLTFGLKSSVYDLIASNATTVEQREHVRTSLAANKKLLFSEGVIPPVLVPVYGVMDDAGDAMVVTFDARNLRRL